MELSLQVEVIGSYVFGIPLRKKTFFLGSQLQAELPRNFIGDLLLDRHEVCRFPPVLIAPELPPIFHIDELGADLQHLTALEDPACQHRAHSKFAADALRFIAAVLEAEHSASRHDSQLGQL